MWDYFSPRVTTSRRKNVKGRLTDPDYKPCSKLYGHLGREHRLVNNVLSAQKPGCTCPAESHINFLGTATQAELLLQHVQETELQYALGFGNARAELRLRTLPHPSGY